MTDVNYDGKKDKDNLLKFYSINNKQKELDNRLTQNRIKELQQKHDLKLSNL